MIMVRELTDDEIIDIVGLCKYPEYDERFYIEFARALFEAAKVQQSGR